MEKLCSVRVTIERLSATSSAATCVTAFCARRYVRFSSNPARKRWSISSVSAPLIVVADRCSAATIGGVMGTLLLSVPVILPYAHCHRQSLHPSGHCRGNARTAPGGEEMHAAGVVQSKGDRAAEVGQ